MPEPGITDRNFARPTTKPLRGPIGHRPGSRRRQRLQIPREYADFQLEDGRRAIDVLGEEFFEPGADKQPRSGNKRTGEEQSEKPGNKSPDLPASLYRDYAPPRPSGPSSGRTIPDGDNDAGFADLPFGPEEEDAADEGAGFPIAKPRPERERGEYATEPPISEWSPAGKEPYAPRRIPTTGDGRVDVRELEKGVTYEVEDGTRFGWDGENFRELYRDRNTGAWRLRTDPAGRRVAGHRGAAATPRELMDAAEDIQRETGRFRVEADRIRVLAIELAGEQDRLRNLRLIGLPDSDPRVRAALDRMADEMPILRKMYDSLVKAARPEVHSVETMAGRAGWPSRSGHATSKFIRGGANVGSKALKGLATGDGSYRYRVLRALETLERDGDFRNIDLSQIKDTDWQKLGHFLQASPEDRARTKQEVVDGINAVQQGWLYSTGEGLREDVEDNFKLNPNFEDEFFTSKLPEGLGKTAAYTGIAAVGRGLGLGGAAAATLVASQELAGEMFDDALEHGATLEQAFRARDLGQMLGLIEAIPIVPLLNKLVPEARGQSLRLLAEIMKSGAETGIKEAAETIGEHLIAGKIVAYDPERQIYEGVVDGAKVSFTSDVLAKTISKALGNI